MGGLLLRARRGGDRRLRRDGGGGGARFAFAFARAPPSGFVGFDGFEAEEEGVRFSDDGASIRREAAAAEPGA